MLDVITFSNTISTTIPYVADFWTSDIHQQETYKDHSKIYLYVNPITVDEGSMKDQNQLLISTLHTNTNQNITSVQQNGETQNSSLEVKEPKKTESNQHIKYKRPPPRPPSVGTGSGMGLLFTSSSVHTSASVSSAAKTKEEVKGNSGEEEERKTTSPAPLRPPVPLHSRGAPPLPPAPLCRISSRKSSNRDAGDGREREKGQNPAKKTEGTIGGEMGDHKRGRKSGLPGEAGNVEENSQEEEMKKTKGKGEDALKEKETKLEEDGKEKSSSQCPTSVKKPSRPVPPPRRKLCDSPVTTNQPGAPNQGDRMRVAAPSPPRRPDVSLYSPQGGTVIGTDPDSCSSSSTEEEGDTTQEQEQQK